MNTNIVRRRAIAVAASVAVSLSALAIPSATAAARTATTAVDGTYLADTLGLPADTVIETVTYDRFQWLLQQPGQFAFLIGSTADANFKANAVKADLAAKAAKATKIYWFDPNLSGQTGIKNLDTRNVAGINLAAASQTIYGNVWKNVLGQYLGNGYKSVPAANRTSVTITADDTVVNDSVNPLFDYRAGKTAAAASTDDLFFVYDKDNKAAGVADKIVSWVNLSTTIDAQSAVSAAFTAAGGGAVIDALSQFNWWKDSANAKHDLAYTDDARYGGDIITDSDSADGWRVQQITYPELLHLLNVSDSADKNFVILFGGTWCHNTRAVLKFINKQAQDNGVAKVYNFDLVLDGGTVNGTNSGANPIHIRDNAYSGTTFNFRPSYLYGDVVRTYFKNLVTEYDPNTGTRVAYYPNGDLTAFPDVVRKLQVPFLINFQRGSAATPSSTAVKRQWIQQNTDASTGLSNFKEYMSEWWFTSPSAQLGLDFAIPKDEATLTAAQATALAQARANVTFAADGLAKLTTFFGGLPGAVVSTQTVSAPAVSYGASASISVAIANAYGRVPNGAVTLAIAGAEYKANVANNAATFTVTGLKPGSYPYALTYATDAQIIGFSTTGNLTVNQAAAPSVLGSATKAPTSKLAGTYKVSVSAPSGLDAATGSVTVTLTKGAASKSITGTLTDGVAKVNVPKLAAGVWHVSIAYPGDTNYASAAVAGSSISVKN